MKILAFEGKHKISDKFEQEMNTVIEQVKDCIPVYKVKGDMTGKIRTLHRNHLYLVRYRDDTDENTVEEEQSSSHVNKEAEGMDVSIELNDEVNKKEEHDTAGAESQCESDNEIEELVVFTRNGDTQNLENNVSEDKVVLGNRRHEGDTSRKEHQKAVSREGMTRLPVNVPAYIRAERGNDQVQWSKIKVVKL